MGSYEALSWKPGSGGSEEQRVRRWMNGAFGMHSLQLSGFSTLHNCSIERSLTSNENSVDVSHMLHLHTLAIVILSSIMRVYSSNLKL